MKKYLLIIFSCLALGALAQKPRLVVPIGHTNAVLSVAFSPDGNYVLTGSGDGTAKL